MCITSDKDFIIMQFYYLVCVASVFNIGWMIKVYFTKNDGKNEDTLHYQKSMKILAIPYVI